MANFHGKQVFKYEGELEKALQIKLQEVQQKTLEDVLKELKKYIRKNVYEIPPEEKDDPFYERTKTLLDIWKISDKVYYHGGVYGGVYGGIETDEAEFEKHQNADLWQHASPIYPDISASDYVNIVNHGVEMVNDIKHSVFGEQEAKPFWDGFLELMDELYPDLFYKNARKLGLEIVEGNKLGAYYSDPKNRKEGKDMNKSVVTGISRGEWTIK